MIISKILNSFDKETRDNIVFGLMVGLIVGLAAWLIVGLAVGRTSGGLVYGFAAWLTVGLMVGLIVGLAAWLAAGRTSGLEYGLAAWFIVGLAAWLAAGLVSGVLSPLWLFVPAIIVFAEVLFYFDNKKLRDGQSKYWFTLERKAEALFESLVIIVNMMNFWVLSQKVDFYAILMQNCHIIVQAIYIIGLAAVGITAIAIWIWLNSLKYNTEQKQEEKKPTRSEITSKAMKEYWRKKKAIQERKS
jgi:MFS family permease